VEEKGSFLFPLDFHEPFDLLVVEAGHIDIIRRDEDRGLDESPYTQGERFISRFIGLDACALDDISLVPRSADLKGDFSLPTRGDDPIEMGHGTASARLYTPDFEGRVSFISYRKAMVKDFPFPHFLQIEFALGQDHFGALLLGRKRLMGKHE
jgi:hypothetical protein